jgi:hypothetical protein
MKEKRKIRRTIPKNMHIMHPKDIMHPMLVKQEITRTFLLTSIVLICNICLIIAQRFEFISR